ncbi:MAG: hypothetical protein M0D53_12980 [Flavobacterium sp. JAD_PAG50586_2]|nr:MAG: hypothetical protein M0D53_12980 [Flavobacterium sp. JAD_PAG50586_2]
MAFQNIPNVKISGLSCCVPKNREKNIESPLFPTTEDAEKFIKSTGIVEKRVVSDDITSSDLCYIAAEKLIADLNWNKDEIDCLIFITQTPDYIVPATSCILQARLGLSKECHAFDITLGCSAWVYGLSIMGSLLSSGCFKKDCFWLEKPPQKQNQHRIKVHILFLGMLVQQQQLSFLKTALGIKFILVQTDQNLKLSTFLMGGLETRLRLNHWKCRKLSQAL